MAKKKKLLRVEVQELSVAIGHVHSDFIGLRDSLATCVNAQSGKVDRLERAVNTMIAELERKKRKKRA